MNNTNIKLQTFTTSFNISPTSLIHVYFTYFKSITQYPLYKPYSLLIHFYHISSTNISTISLTTSNYLILNNIFLIPSHTSLSLLIHFSYTPAPNVRPTSPSQYQEIHNEKKIRKNSLRCNTTIDFPLLVFVKFALFKKMCRIYLCFK